MILPAAIIVLFLAQSQVAAPPAAALIRVCVLPAADAGAPDLRESAKDLTTAFQDKKKDILVVTTEDHPDVTITVTDRGLTVPKVAIGVVPIGRAGAPGAGPMRVTHVTVTLTSGKDELEIRNKNSPMESSGGWKSAADDIAKQVEKWIADHKAAILAARGGLRTSTR